MITLLTIQFCNMVTHLKMQFFKTFTIKLYNLFDSSILYYVNIQFNFVMGEPGIVGIRLCL